MAETKPTEPYRDWEYARSGDYHRNPDPNWSYTPTYLRKMSHVRQWLERFCEEHVGAETRILDAGCGEGVLVEEYAARGWQIEGLDLNYSSPYVRRGDLLAMPYEDNRFDAILLLDVFEHLAYVDQPRALQEMRRVLKPKGWLLASIPNLAHFNSRLQVLLRGRLDRTDSEINHVGERPIAENVALLKANRFHIQRTIGVTLTVPWLYRRLICRNPAKYRWLHDLLEPVAIASLAMVDLFICQRLD
jgi:2-polyprenyl-3-methyl-5-hydroxy-6-metoxy-1,4-benzoquinol methylase